MRNNLLKAVQLMIVLAFVMSACASPAATQQATTPQVIEKTVVVTQEVPVEKIVEKVVAPSEYTLTVLNPQGAVTAANTLAPRLSTLEGKTVALWLSATADEVYAGLGGPLYDEMAKMLKEKFPTINIVSYTDLPQKYAPFDEVMTAITEKKPDAVVIAFGG